MSDEFLKNIVFSILFVLPGVLISLIYKYFTPTSKKEPEGYEKTGIAFLYSCLVLGLNLLILNMVRGLYNS